MSRFATLIAAACLLAVVPAFAQEDFENAITMDQLREGLMAGGHVIFFRHAMTERDYADQIDAVLSDCSTQRVLSEFGWQQARQIGAAFDMLQVPIDKVISSQYCRAWQTADLAFGSYMKNPRLNFERAEEYTDEQFARMRANVTPLFARIPTDGNNTVIVGHDDPFEATTGYYPEPQGVSFVIKPLGGTNFELLARLEPDDWTALAMGMEETTDN